MRLRHLLPVFAFLIATLSSGQAAQVQTGKPFSRTLKNAVGDLYTVVDGMLLDDKQALLYVEDGLVPKVVRLDAQLMPTDELVLKAYAFDGLIWNGVAPIMVDGSMHCLLVSAGKKSAEYAIGKVGSRGAPTLSGLRKVASSPILYSNSSVNTLPSRPQPDPILFTKGLAYAQQERIVPSADGAHFLLNNYTVDAKGGKQFWFAYLDTDFKELWSGVAMLPYEDVKSSIHQISIANDGTIHLLTYVFKCDSEGQVSDKMCHELHLTTLTEQGKTVKDILIDKDFVSSARICERENGKLSMAVRYGSLTGQPGLLMTFDPLEPKIKATPLVDQRLASVRKTKLLAYGSIEPGAKKTTTAKTAKVPNEVVDLLPAWGGGLVLVETFLETAYQIPMGEAIAMRRLCGDVRTTYAAANDSIQWQHIAERAFMTTAGQAYEGVDIHLTAEGLTLFYNHTPKGLDAIMTSGNAPEAEAADVEVDKKEKKENKEKIKAPAEAGVMKAITMDPRGSVLAEGTVLMHPNRHVPCPMPVLHSTSGKVYLVRSYDRNTTYGFSLVDPSLAGK